MSDAGPPIDFSVLNARAGSMYPEESSDTEFGEVTLPLPSSIIGFATL